MSNTSGITNSPQDSVQNRSVLTTENEFTAKLTHFVDEMKTRLQGQEKEQNPLEGLQHFVEEMDSRLTQSNTGTGAPTASKKPTGNTGTGQPTKTNSPTQTTGKKATPGQTAGSTQQAPAQGIPTQGGSSAPAADPVTTTSPVTSGTPTATPAATGGTTQTNPQGTPAQAVPTQSTPASAPATGGTAAGGATQTGGTQQREFYTDVIDANKNGTFDQADVVSVTYDKEKISTELASRQERIILMGEDHNDQPIDTIEATVQKIAAQNKPVIYTIELSSEYLSANGPDLIERLNKGEITPEEFESRFVRQLENSYGADIAVDPKDVASTIVRMHNAGAKVVPIDDGSKAVLDYSEANGTTDFSQIKGINRDEIMANNIVNLYNENPDAVIISSLGGVHAQTNVGVKNNFGSSDSENPVGTRLISSLGRNEVFSVYNYETASTKENPYYDIVADGYLNGEFGQEVAYDTWDMFIPANAT